MARLTGNTFSVYETLEKIPSKDRKPSSYKQNSKLSSCRTVIQAD